MGIRELWNVVSPARKQTTFSTLSWEHFKDTGRPLVIGVDASIWFFQIQAALSARGLHSQLGSNPELATFFYKLSFFLSLPISLVFVLDGPQRPAIKQGKTVHSVPHWMIHSVRELVTAFGYHIHQAPGEAEAELGNLNHIGHIDAVFTVDSDILLFGAEIIIRPNDTGDLNDVAVYHANDIATNTERPLMPGGLLLMAILCGGDYDKGLERCGWKTAYGLTNTELGSELLLASDEDAATIRKILPAWREKLRDHLARDPHGFIGRKNVGIASNIPGNFPSMDVVRKYTHPVISHTLLAAAFLGWGHLRLPNIPVLSELTERLFLWKSIGKQEKKFTSKIFDGFCVRYLMLLSSPGHSFPEGSLIPRVLNIVDVKSAHDNILFSVEFDIAVLAHASLQTSTLTKKKVWAPSVVLTASHNLLALYLQKLNCSKKKTLSIQKKIELVD
ncbi:PIN domain-like protein [Dendrothele bispora CBS 962.96]|uniref:PIN domain-like protein n=1 Tax=Dendrothele bispora (strain CBS 962.96) TaxID=1314807 RepID=A0A4S8KWT7_DENBC|nr:PIN domain-like protein [Dendrothele bispora CBS 962.96]